ncbi:MAG TPA: hypothetical protein PK781_09460, partial [Terrimesophilobacter sp.]|nr:hypothetical protein [Terrimesophilobacter sp.]
MTSTTGPRTTRRRRLLPAVALVAVTGIVTGSFALADGAPPPSVGGAAAAYVPADGYVSWSLHTGSGTDIRRITEHSRSTGVNQVLALPPLQQSPTLDAVGEGVATTHFWRETTRALDGDDTRQLIDLYSVTDVGVSLVASYGGDYGWV